VAPSQRLRRVQAEDGWIDATGSIGPFYPRITAFYVLCPRVLLFFFAHHLISGSDSSSRSVSRTGASVARPRLAFPQSISHSFSCRSQETTPRVSSVLLNSQFSSPPQSSFEFSSPCCTVEHRPCFHFSALGFCSLPTREALPSDDFSAAVFTIRFSSVLLLRSGSHSPLLDFSCAQKLTGLFCFRCYCYGPQRTQSPVRSVRRVKLLLALSCHLSCVHKVFDKLLVRAMSSFECECLQLEVSCVREPSDQRLKFSSFFSCFARGFFVTHMRCSMKCV
jgi:hypothetical protein